MARNNYRIEKGQRLSSAVSASGWNRAQDAADLVLGSQGGISGDGASYSSAPYQWVYAKNSTGSVVPRWGVMAISGLEIVPTSSPGVATSQFEQMPVLTGATPQATTTAWCIAVEPIENNKIGRVAVSGVVQAKVDIQSADATTVSAKPSSVSELKTAGKSGQGLVLWKESGTGSGKWCLIRLGGGGGEPVRLGKTTSAWNKGAIATINLYPAGTPGSESQGSPATTLEDCVNKFANVGSGKWVIVALAGNDAWYLIAAEC